MRTYRRRLLDGRGGWLTRAVALWLGCLVGQASGQPPSGNNFGAQNIRRPTVSPYLNLMRTGDPGIDFAINYQNLVRPQQQFLANESRLNSRLNNLQRQVNGSIRPDGTLILPGTGHATSFLNTGNYFPGYRRR